MIKELLAQFAFLQGEIFQSRVFASEKGNKADGADGNHSRISKRQKSMEEETLRVMH